MKKLLASISFIIFIVGCTPKPSYNQLAMQLQMNMSKQDVISLLGQPNKVSARNTDKGHVEVLSYWRKTLVGFSMIDNQMLSQDRLSVTLLNNKVTEWGDKLDPAEMLEKSQEMTRESLEKIQNNITNKK